MTKQTPSFLFVDGIDGSGKSTFASNLNAALCATGLRTTVLHVDDFRNPVDWDAVGESEEAVYYDKYYDLLTLEFVIEQIGQGATQVRVPVFHEGHDRQWSFKPMPQCDLVVLEGVFTQRLANASRAGLLYIELPWQTARERILVRDQAKGRSIVDVTSRIDRRYFPGQRRYETECSPRKVAHWLASTTVGSDTLKISRTTLPLAWPPELIALVDTQLARLMSVGAKESAI